VTNANPSGGITRWPLIAAGVLVVAGAVAMVFIARPPAPPPAGTMAPAAGPRTLSGDGILAGPEARFAWSRDGRADVYRLEVYDLSSRLLAAAVLRDTSVIATAVLPESARAGLWRVVPVSAGGTELPPTTSNRFDRP